MKLQLAAVAQAFSPVEHWPRYAGLLMLIFFGRGLVLLSILPPLEAWDEYQHIAVMEHLLEHESPPILGKANVSTRLLERTVAFPQANSMLEQTRNTGAVGYEAYAAATTPPNYREGHPPIHLYQAQQGSLYYRLTAPLYRWVGGSERLEVSIAGLRLLNLIAVTLALGVVFWTLGSISSGPGAMALLGLAVAFQPLFLLNACRVANDGLAVSLASLVISIVFLRRWNTVSRQLALALALSLAVLAKSTNLALIPFVCISLVRDWRSGGIDSKKLSAATLAIAVIGAVLLGPDLWSNYQLHGTPTAMQEAVINHDRGASLSDYLGALVRLPYRRLASMWTAPWIGGWSFLEAPILLKGASALVMLSMFAGFLSTFAGGRDACSQFREPGSARWTMFWLVVCISVGLWWHMLVSFVAWGQSYTNPWYAAAGFPFFLALAFEGAAQWPVRVRRALAYSLVGCFFIMECAGELFSMLPTYGQAGISWESLRRIELLLPSWLGSGTLMAALGVTLVAGLVALRSSMQHGSASTGATD